MSPFYSGLTCGIILGILGFALTMFALFCLEVWTEQLEKERENR